MVLYIKLTNKHVIIKKYHLCNVVWSMNIIQFLTKTKTTKEQSRIYKIIFLILKLKFKNKTISLKMKSNGIRKLESIIQKLKSYKIII